MVRRILLRVHPYIGLVTGIILSFSPSLAVRWFSKMRSIAR